MAKEEKQTLKQELSRFLHDNRQASIQVSTVTIDAFAEALEALMNEAVQSSLVESDQKMLWAHWANHLGDLWREVKQHV
jgi:hypothetical protein